MKKSLLSILMMFAVVGMFAQDLPTALTQEIDWADEAPVVDAINDDAAWPSAIALPYTFQAEMPEATDVSASVQLAWGELGLFIYMAVTDDMQNYLETDGTTYLQDNIEIFYYFGDDFGPEAVVTAVENDEYYYQLRFQLTDDFEVAHDGRVAGAWAALTLGAAADDAAEAGMATTGAGYDLELILPWGALNLLNDPANDMEFGFDIAVGDADEGDRDNQLSLLNDSKQDLAWNNKAYCNTAKLVGQPNNVISVKGSDFFVSTVAVDGILNVSNIGDVVIYNMVGSEVMRAQNVNGTLNVSNLQSGVYVLKTVQGSVKFVR